MATFKAHIIKLYFKTPLHLSRGKSDYTDIFELLHSDTLKSALFVSAKELGLDVDENFFNSFLISSAFPFNGDQLFFPKPYVRLPIVFNDIDKEGVKNKILKKLLYVGQMTLEAIINNRKIEITKNHFSADRKFLFDTSDIQGHSKFVVHEEVQRVQIKPGEDAEPYYAERLRFTSNAGLFFLLKSDQENINEIIKSALNLLADSGIGSYKNIGNGNFSFEWISNGFNLEVPSEPTDYINLSLYCPTKNEIENILEQSSYQLIKRGGYIANAENHRWTKFRKRSVFMFAEGGRFKNPGFALKGKIVNLQPKDIRIEHPVWRDGTSVFLPVAIND